MSVDAVSGVHEKVMLSDDGTHEPDFHVVSLTYSMTEVDGVSYDSPPSVHFETDESAFHLEAGKLTCRMKHHFSTTEQGRAAVEPVLRAWELDADLRLGRGGLRFRFKNAEVIDRTPAPPGVVRSHVLLAGSGDMCVIGGTVSLRVTLRSYPAPTPDFRVTPDVSTLYNRYQGYRDGKEPLQAMAYFCLTVLEVGEGGRRNAAVKYNIHELVLGKLGELTSERGDPSTARKMKAPAMQPLSGAETAWIQEAIKQMIWRLGDQRSTTELPTITMADLPSL